MSIYLTQINRILAKVNIDDPKIKDLQQQLANVKKSSSLLNDPSFQNVINILTPYMVHYKVNQVLKLLKELGKGHDIDPRTGLTRFI